MKLATKRRMSGWGCIFSLIVLIASAVAAFQGHAVYLLPAAGVLLGWWIFGSVLGREVRCRQQGALESAFEGFKGARPRLVRTHDRGLTYFNIVFEKHGELQRATAEGRVESFKRSVQVIHEGEVGDAGCFVADNAVCVSTEAGQKERERAVEPMTVWGSINVLAVGIVLLSAFVGVLSNITGDQELKAAELGILKWPLTGLFLISFLYMATYLIFTGTRNWIKVLWAVTVALLVFGLVFAFLIPKG